jgi:LPXTG-motif cell wall-anchored protein
MSVHVRRSLAASVLAGGLLVAAPALAFADDYAPTTPSPTVSAVKHSTAKPSHTPKVEAAVSPRALPRTGTDVAVWGITGAALVFGGSALVVASRKRSSASH